MPHLRGGHTAVNRLRHVFPELQNRKLDEITPWLVEKWRLARLKAGIKPTTVNRDLAELKAALNPGTYRGTVQFSGHRSGPYTMRWQVSDTSFGTVLVGGKSTVHVQPGIQVRDITFDLETLGDRYLQRVLSGGTGVLVEEPFHLTVTIEPTLNQEQIQALPPGEQTRLRLGASPLRSSKRREFPVRFVIGHDGRINP